MQDGTYPPRNFATLGPLWLQPPFTGTYKNCYYNFISFYSTGQVSDFIIQIFSKSCVFKKQSLPSFYSTVRWSLSRSYKPILPSSFNIIITLIFVKNKTTSVSFNMIYKYKFLFYINPSFILKKLNLGIIYI